MNKKTNTDRDLLEHVERVIHESENSDIELINILAQTRPPQNPSLRDDLEVDLMARLHKKQAKTHKHILMKRHTGRINTIKRYLGSLPFTLAAAILAVIVAGGLIFSVQHFSLRSPENSAGDTNPSVLITANQLTPDTTPTVATPAPNTIDGNDCRVRIANLLTRLYGDASVSATDITSTSINNADWYRVRVMSGNTEIGYILVDGDCTNIIPERLFTEKRIGIVVGHQGVMDDRGAVCEDGFSEVEVNQAIADALMTALLNSGYAVDIFDELDPDLRGYEADLLVALHTGDCNGAFLSGYSYAFSSIDTALLHECLRLQYVTATGLQPISASHDIRNSHLSQVVDAATPILLLEMGRLASDRILLTEERQRVVTGILNTVNCLL
jgi:hypothetical protein